MSGRVKRTIPMLLGVRALAGAYDVAILDLWGVVHDGHAPYPGVLDCLARMRRAGMRLVFLSNAPRRAKRVIHRLSAIGIPRASYDHIITSGDLTRRALARRSDSWHAALGRTYYHLGPARDWGITRGLDFEEIDELVRASFILNTGLFDDEHETVDDYEAFFDKALAAALPMICVNPDLAVMRGDRRIPCAGALAAPTRRAVDPPAITANRIAQPMMRALNGSGRPIDVASSPSETACTPTSQERSPPVWTACLSRAVFMRTNGGLRPVNHPTRAISLRRVCAPVISRPPPFPRFSGSAGHLTLACAPGKHFLWRPLSLT